MDASEIITAVVALYAAVVATLTFVFQRRDKRERETSRCEVEVGLYEMVDPILGKRRLQGVNVKLINRSEHPVSWTGLAFRPQDRRDTWLVPTAYLVDPKLPLTVPSRDAADVMLDRGKLEEAGMEWNKPVLVQAWIATGEQFYSHEQPLT